MFTVIDNDFKSPLEWKCPPPSVRILDEDGQKKMEVHTEADTDLWSNTFYGFVRKNPHFFYTSISSTLCRLIPFFNCSGLDFFLT